MSYLLVVSRPVRDTVLFYQVCKSYIVNIERHELYEHLIVFDNRDFDAILGSRHIMLS